MFVVIVEFDLHPQFSAAFFERVRQQARDSLTAEADCHLFDVCTDPGRPEYALLYEVYTDSSAFDAHLASAHFLDFDATVRDWIADKRVRLLERV